MKKWKQTAGFTLVELIVVIAILGILAGVGTVGYSGYIKKANQAVDRQLVSDVSYAIQLYSVSNNLGKDKSNGSLLGYVLLTDADNNAVIVKDGAGSDIDKAMSAAFGEGYENALKLKYDSWSPVMLTEAANGYAASVANSGYITNVGTGKLLGDVQDCTSALSQFMEAFTSDKAAAVEILSGFLDYDNKNENSAFNKAITSAGYTSSNNYDGMSSDVLANATVFGIAEYTKDHSDDVLSGFTQQNNGYLTYNLGGYAENSEDLLYVAAGWYAAGEAFVAYLDDPECTAIFNNIGKTGNKIEILNNMTSAYSAIKRKALTDPALRPKVYNYYNTPGADNKTQAQRDGEAYISIMGTVNNISTDYTDASNLSNAELFTSSGIADRLDSYVSGATASGDTAVADAVSNHSAAVVYMLADGADGVKVIVDMSDTK